MVDTPKTHTSGKRVIVVLEKAQLELAQLKGRFELLNCDDHKTMLAKSGKDVGAYRPDILHQCLMMLLDSPLNKAGKLSIYIHTQNNILIEVSPSLRIPRTFKRFCGLMIELINRHKIRAVGSNEVLMKVIANPIQKYLPVGGIKVGLSVDGDLQRFDSAFAKELLEAGRADSAKDDEAQMPVTVVIGAVAHGDPVSEVRFGADYVEKKVAISNYGLSAAICCSKVCSAFEECWKIL